MKFFKRKKENKSKQDSLYVRVLHHASKYPQGFKCKDILEHSELVLEEWEKKILERHFLSACQRFGWTDNTKGETIFQFIIGDYQKYLSETNEYTLTFEAEFTFIDYEELKFARENAQSAKRFSWLAIVLSVFAIIVSALIPYLIAKNMTQNVLIDDNQLKEIRNSTKLLDSKFLEPKS